MSCNVCNANDAIMQYYPYNLVSVEYVLNTLENFKNEPSEILAVVRQESIQKLGELAEYLGNDMQRIADRYQLYVNRQQLTGTISAISGAIATAVPVPIVQGLGVLVSLAGSLFSGVSGKNAAKAQAEIQVLQAQIAQVVAALQTVQESTNGSTSTTLLLIVFVILAFFFIG